MIKKFLAGESSLRFAKPIFMALASFASLNAVFSQIAQENPVVIPLHSFNSGGQQRLAIYVGVNGGKPRPYLFDTGSAIFEAVVGNGPYNPAKPVRGITPIPNLYGTPNTYPDFGYAYEDGNGFGGTLVHATVSLYGALTDTTPIVTYKSTGPNGPIINALAGHYINETNRQFTYDTNYWPAISSNQFPLESNIVGTFGAGAFVQNNDYYISITNSNSGWVNLSNGITYGSVIGQVTHTGYIVDATSSNPVLIIGLNDQLTSQFTNVVWANLSTNPATTNFPGSGTPSFDTQDVTLQETISGTNNTDTPGTNQSVTLSNMAVLLDTGTPDLNTKIDSSNNPNALLFVDTNPVGTNSKSNDLLFDNNTFSAATENGTALSITTSKSDTTFKVGTGEYTLGIGVFLQSSVLYNLQEGTIGFLNSQPVNPLSLPQYDHIVVVILENHSYTEVAAAPLPFINGYLRAGGADITQSYSLQHPSQPNYYWLFSGSNQGIANDYLAPTFLSNNSVMSPFTNAPNLSTELTGIKKTFGGYLDAYPGASNIYSGNTVGGIVYVPRHVPWLGFSNVPVNVTRNFQTFGTTAASFSKLPTVSFVIPGLEHDMHDYATGKEVNDTNESLLAMSNADIWLSGALKSYAQWAVSNNSLLIVTTDEDSTADWATPPHTNPPETNYHDSNPVALTAPTASFSPTNTTTNGGAQTGPNQITTIFYGAHVVPGAYPEGNGITHVNVLRTIEWLCGITSGAGAQSSAVTNIGAAPVTDIFGAYVGSDKFPGNTPDYGNWIVNGDQSNTNDMLYQYNGLHFLVPQMSSSDHASWVWKVSAPSTADWRVSLGVTNLASSSISNSLASIGLNIRNASDPANYGFGASLVYDKANGGLEWQSALDQGTNTFLQTINSSVSKGAVLLSYSATNQTLTAAYSVNPGTAKPSWVNLGSATLADLNMSITNPAANSFQVTVSGDASYMTLGMNSSVAAGNFMISNGATNIVAPNLLPQTITFPPIPTLTNTNVPYQIKPPVASSKLSVTVSVQSGPATISGNSLTLTNTGSVVLLATQPGNDKFAPASQTVFFQVIIPIRVKETNRDSSHTGKFSSPLTFRSSLEPFP